MNPLHKTGKNDLSNNSGDGVINITGKTVSSFEGNGETSAIIEATEVEAADVLSQKNNIDDAGLSDSTKMIIKELGLYLSEAEINKIIKDAELLASVAMKAGPEGLKAKTRLQNIVKQPASSSIALTVKIQDLRKSLEESSPDLQEALVNMQTELSKTAKSKPKNAVGFLSKLGSKLGIKKLDEYLDKKAIDKESLKDYIGRVAKALDAAEKKIEDVGTLAMTVMDEQQQITQDILIEMIKLKISHDIISKQQKALASDPQYQTETGSMILANVTNTLTLPIEKQVISMSHVVHQNKLAHDNLLTLASMKDVLKDKCNEVRVVGINAMSNALTQMGISASLKDQATFLQKMGEASSELILQSAKSTSDLVQQVATLSEKDVIDPQKITEANNLLTEAYKSLTEAKKASEEKTHEQFQTAYESALKLGEELKAYGEAKDDIGNIA